MNSQTQNPQHPEITEKLKHVVEYWGRGVRMYPTFAIWVQEEGCIETFLPNEEKELLEYIKNMDLEKYKFENGLRQEVELIWEYDDNNCDTIYTIQEEEEEK